VASYVFLSEEWLGAARELHAEYADRLAKIPHAVRVNLLVNESPLDPPEVEVHLDTAGGDLVLNLGHVDEADLFVTVDYATAKALLVEGNPQAAMQAFLQNRIRVEGEVGKLMVLAQQPMGAEAAEYAERLRAITAD